MTISSPLFGLVRSARCCCAVFGILWANPLLAAQVEDTSFSVKRGFFESPFDVAISTKTSGATIRYTLDGSVPTATHGTVYQWPLVINRTSTLRAAAFKSGSDPSNTDTQTYIFLDDVLTQIGAGFPADWGSLGTFGTEPGNHPPGPHLADYAMDPDVVNDPLYAPTIRDDMRAIPTLSIVMNRDDFFSSEPIAYDEENNVIETRGIYPISKGFERAASAEFILPDGNSAFQINCSIEIQGATSTDRWKTAKLSMRLKFKAPYGPSELDYPLFGDDASDSVNTVILDSTNQQSWTHPVTSQQLRAQYIRDQFVGDLQNAVGGLAPHGRYAHVYIDGLYWGVYWMHEFIEEAFAVAYRGGKREDYDILRHRFDNAVAGTTAAYAEMLTIVDTDLSIPANYTALQIHLDLPQFADYMLINFYAGNADWAFQNWNATFNRVDPAKKWQFHNWDGEKTWQDVNDNNTDFTNPGAPTYIHQQLRANPDYRLLFADHIHKHFFNGGLMTPTVAAQKYTSRLSQIDRAIVGESARWGDNRNPADPPYTRATWIAERDRLLTTYFPNRTAVVLQQLKDDGLYPDTAAPVFSLHGGNVTAGFLLSITNTNPGGTIFYTLDGKDPRDPAAIVYSAAVPINQSVHIKSRIFTTEWSALNEAVFTVPSDLANLRVTEIMYNPKKLSGAESTAGFTDPDQFEFIEIENTGVTVLQLEDLRFSEGIQFTFPAMSLAAGSRVIVAKDSAAFTHRYGAGIATIAGEFGGSLSNSGEMIALTGGFGEAIQSFTFDDDWHPSTDGGGFSLVTINATGPLPHWNLATGWRASAYTNGSPGVADATPAPLRITEINYHPGKSTAAEIMAGFPDEEQFEYIEIRNVGSSAVNLSSAALSGSVSYAFGNVSLPAGGFILVVRNTAAFTNRYGAGATIAGAFTSGDLSNSAGNITLIGPSGETLHNFTYNDNWYPETDGDGATLAIASDSQARALWSEKLGWLASVERNGSPGAAEPAALPTLRVCEIMYNSPEPSLAEINAGYDNNDDFDFIELQNTGTTALNLAGYSLGGGIAYTFSTVTLQPGARVIIVEDAEAFALRYGPGIPITGTFSQGLDNGSDEIILRDAGSRIIQRFTYSDNWYPATDGNGPSLEIINTLAHPVTWSAKSSWRPSGTSQGNPGSSSSAFYVWQWGNFGAAILPGADSDNDGISNLFEYAFQLDPDKRNSTADHCHFTLVEKNGEFFPALSFQANRLATDANITVEISDNLSNWLSSTELLETYIATDVDAATERFVVRALEGAATQPQRYLRIKVQLAE